MKDEIERKYLIMPHAKWQVIKFCDGKPFAHIRQGYISVTDPEIRIRSAEEYSQPHMLTIKIGEGLSRRECNISVDNVKAQELWSAVAHIPIEKTRYEFGRWEIDVYTQDRFGGLILAEIELYSVNEQVEFPEWMGPLVLAEVTDDKKYKNKRLALL